MAHSFPQDDGKAWGFMSGDRWIELPKTPLLLANLGPPPFGVEMPSGEMRHVVHQPVERDGYPVTGIFPGDPD